MGAGAKIEPRIQGRGCRGAVIASKPLAQAAFLEGHYDVQERFRPRLEDPGCLVAVHGIIE